VDGSGTGTTPPTTAPATTPTGGAPNAPSPMKAS
jgi:hypothetical protein